MRVLIACPKYIHLKFGTYVRVADGLRSRFLHRLKIRKVFRDEMTRGVIDYVHTVLLDTLSFYEHDKNACRF